MALKHDVNDFKTIIVRDVPLWLDYVVEQRMRDENFKGNKNDFMLEMIHKACDGTEVYQKMKK